jgi:hypothetical protein
LGVVPGVEGGVVYSKVKIAGHPVHPMLIAFPVAGYTGTLVGFAVYAATGHQFWLNLAIALNLIGVCAAALAAVPGLADWAFGIPRDSAAKRVGMIHAGLNVAASRTTTWESGSSPSRNSPSRPSSTPTPPGWAACPPPDTMSAELFADGDDREAQ